MAKRRGQATKGTKLVGETNRTDERQGKAFEKGEKRKKNT